MVLREHLVGIINGVIEEKNNMSIDNPEKQVDLDELDKFGKTIDNLKVLLEDEQEITIVDDVFIFHPMEFIGYKELKNTVNQYYEKLGFDLTSSSEVMIFDGSFERVIVNLDVYLNQSFIIHEKRMKIIKPDKDMNGYEQLETYLGKHFNPNLNIVAKNFYDLGKSLKQKGKEKKLYDSVFIDIFYNLYLSYFTGEPIESIDLIPNNQIKFFREDKKQIEKYRKKLFTIIDDACIRVFYESIREKKVDINLSNFYVMKMIGAYHLGYGGNTEKFTLKRIMGLFNSVVQ